MHLEIVSTEAWRPITSAELRANMRRTNTAEDTLLESFLMTSIRFVERRTKTSVLGRSLRLSLPEWFSSVELPAPPLRHAAIDDPSTAVAITYRNDVGTYVAAPADGYRLYADAQVWRLERGDEDLPDIGEHPRAIRITYAVGYRDAAHLLEVAPDLRDAIMLHASHRDSNREATIIEPKMTEISRKAELSFDALIAPYKVQTRYSDLWTALEA